MFFRREFPSFHWDHFLRALVVFRFFGEGIHLRYSYAHFVERFKHPSAQASFSPEWIMMDLCIKTPNNFCHRKFHCPSFSAAKIPKNVDFYSFAKILQHFRHRTPEISGVFRRRRWSTRSGTSSTTSRRTCRAWRPHAGSRASWSNWRPSCCRCSQLRRAWGFFWWFISWLMVRVNDC